MQQMQPTAPRNSNLRELPIAPSHVLEMSGNRSSSTPAAQVKPIVNASPPSRAVVASRSSQGKSDAKVKPLSPGAQPKEETKAEPEVGPLSWDMFVLDCQYVLLSSLIQKLCPLNPPK